MQTGNVIAVTGALLLKASLTLARGAALAGVAVVAVSSRGVGRRSEPAVAASGEQ